MIEEFVMWNRMQSINANPCRNRLQTVYANPLQEPPADSLC